MEIRPDKNSAPLPLQLEKKHPFDNERPLSILLNLM